MWYEKIWKDSCVDWERICGRGFVRALRFLQALSACAFGRAWSRSGKLPAPNPLQKIVTSDSAFRKWNSAFWVTARTPKSRNRYPRVLEGCPNAVARLQFVSRLPHFLKTYSNFTFLNLLRVRSIKRSHPKTIIYRARSVQSFLVRRPSNEMRNNFAI